MVLAAVLTKLMLLSVSSPETVTVSVVFGNTCWPVGGISKTVYVPSVRPLREYAPAAFGLVEIPPASTVAPAIGVRVGVRTSPVMVSDGATVNVPSVPPEPTVFPSRSVTGSGPAMTE